MTYILEFDGEIQEWDLETEEAAYDSIRKDHEAWIEDCKAFPDMHGAEDEFWFDGYRIFKEIPVDPKRVTGE